MTTRLRWCTLNYGFSHISFRLPKKNLLGVVKPKRIQSAENVGKEIEGALANPIGSDRISKSIGKEDKITILIDDITRPSASGIILPSIIKEIRNTGVDLKNTTILIATGMHRKHTSEEKETLIGEILLGKIAVTDHVSTDRENLTHFGKTSHGTELKLNSLLDRSDFVIATGCVDIHWFAGYTGGSKSILPGVAGPESIQQNHAMLLSPKAKAGLVYGNPVREDIEEAGKIADLDFILNVVLNDKKKIIRAFAGDRLKAYSQGTKLFDELYKMPLSRKADIVIASPGGFPKDINLYQAQKALDNASYAAKDGGIIILVAECGERYGGETFERWMRESATPEEIVERIKSGFILGGHKAYGFAKLLKRLRKIILVSSIDERLINKSLLTAAKSIEDALNLARKELGYDSEILVMPNAGSTYFSIADV